MDRENIVKRFADYVYYFKAYCTSDADDHEMLKAGLSMLKEQGATIKRQQDVINIMASEQYDDYPLCKDGDKE